MSFIEREEYFRDARIKQMARYEHYRCVCEECGIDRRLVSRWERFEHWFICGTLRRFWKAVRRVFFLNNKK